MKSGARHNLIQGCGNDEKFKRVIEALSALEDHAASELTPQDLKDNVVVKIADEVTVDVSRSAWKVTFLEAQSEFPILASLLSFAAKKPIGSATKRTSSFSAAFCRKNTPNPQHHYTL